MSIKAYILKFSNQKSLVKVQLLAQQEEEIFSAFITLELNLWNAREFVSTPDRGINHSTTYI